MLKRAPLVAALPVPLSIVAAPLPARAAPALTATFSAANNRGVNGEWQSATGAAPGQYQEEAATRGYANLVAMVPGCTVFNDTQSISTNCYTGNGGQWWSFDDTWSIRHLVDTAEDELAQVQGPARCHGLGDVR
jgi:hypothetical protein